jgi:DNA-binding beta-propeller fold protein YncE
MRNWSATLLLFSFFVLNGVAAGQKSPALSLKTRIPLANVGGRMDHLGVDMKGQRLFATAFYNHTAEVIDLQAGRQVHTIANLAEPQGLFYDAATNHLFVASSMDGTVKILDPPCQHL